MLMYDNRMFGNLASPGKPMHPSSQPEGFPPQSGYPPPQQRNSNSLPGSASFHGTLNGPFMSPTAGPPANQSGGAPSPGSAMFPGSQPGSFPPQSGFTPPQQRNMIPPSGSANQQSLQNGAVQSPIGGPAHLSGASMFPSQGLQSDSFPPQSGYPPPQQKSLNPPPGSFNPQSQSNGGAAQSPIGGPPPSSEASMFPGSQSDSFPLRSGYPMQQKPLNPPLGSANLLSQSNGSIQSPIGGPSPNQSSGPPPSRTSVSPGPQRDSFPPQPGYPPSQQRNFNPPPGSANSQQSNGGAQTPNSRPPSNPSPAVSSSGSSMFPGSQQDSFPPQSGFLPPPKTTNLSSGQNPPNSPSNGPLQSPMSGPPLNQAASVPSLGMPTFPGSQSEGFPPQSGFPPQQKNLNPISGPGAPLGGPPSNQIGGPPSNQIGAPPSNQIGAPPSNQIGGPPSNQISGPPSNQIGGPPSNLVGGMSTLGASMFPGSQLGGFSPQSGFPGPQQKSLNPLPGSANPPSPLKGGVQSPIGGPPSNQPGGLPLNQLSGPPSSQPGGPPPRTSMSPGPQLEGFPPQQKSFNAPPGPINPQSQSNGGAALSPMGGPPLNQPGSHFSFGSSSYPGSQPEGFPPQQKGFNPPPGPINPQSQSNGTIQSPIGGPPTNQSFGGVPSLQRGMQQMGLGGPPQQQPPNANLPPSGPPRGPSNFTPQQSRLSQPGGALPPKPYPTSQVDGPPGAYSSNASPAPGLSKLPNRMPQFGNQSYGQQQQQFGSSPNLPPQPSGYPGPGGYPSPGGYPQAGYMSQGQQSPYPSQPEQPRKLNPDQMPSPIQVIVDDQRAKSGKFFTNQKGLLPPLVTTDFIVQDQGNASARFIRSTMYNIPTTIDMMKQASVPFGVVLSPLAQIKDGENEPPLVDMGESGPVRCVRCKAYMSPFMQFIDGGRRFHCLLCKATSEVPPNYFQHLDHTGQRVDRYERPELVLGAYEFVATKEYCTNGTFPKPPAMIFLLDVSYNNIKSGMVHLLCSQMRSILQHLPKEPGQSKSSVRVGFITYNNTVHFYNIKACLGQPQMMVVGDVGDMFMPLLDGFLCDPEESEQVILSLMEQIPSMFADTRETETILAPAITAGLEALKAAECAGKLLVFHSSLPIAEAPGKLKNRDDRKLLGTDKEKTVLSPQNTVYNNLGQDCVGAGCSVDLFIFNNSYIDLPTIGQVSRLTGGQIYKYTYFQAENDGERLIMDICEDISRPIAFNAIMRVRTSTGIRPTDFYGHFYMSNTTDMEFGSIDCNKAVAVEIKHDDKLTEEDGVYIQVALLYTSCTAQRRVRVLNLALNTCSQMADLFRACELDTIINFFSKQAVSKLFEATPKAVKEALINRCAQILACYRKHCALPSSAGQLILPECMKLLPLYINCVLKSDAVAGGSDLTIDDRWFAMDTVMISDIPSSVVYFYPRLIPLIDIDVTSLDIPVPLRCSMDKMNNDGAYLLENGIYMFLWVGLNVSNDWIMNVFGVSSVMQIDTDKSSLPYLENPLNARIRELIKSLRVQRQRAMRLTIVRPRDKMEVVMKHFLVEDSGVDGSSSYVDFLCYMHKEIRNLLS